MLRYPETGYVKYLTDEEFALIGSWISKLRSPSMKMLIRVLMYMGLRVGEVIMLKRDNFSSDFGKLWYLPLKKRGVVVKERVVPDFLRRELAGFWHDWHHRSRCGFLFFPSYKNCSSALHLQASSVRYRFMQMRRAIKVEDRYFRCSDGKWLYRLSPHTLRHYCARRYYLASGNNLFVAKNMLGHVKLETTARYVLSVDDQLVEQRVINCAFSS